MKFITITPFILILSLLVCLFVYLIKRYMQIGDTCGFYSLVYAASKNLHINKKKMVRKIIMESIKGNDSYVGEIFDLNTMKKIGEHYFPELEIDIIPISSIDELDSLMEEYYVVLPCLHGNIPHYVFLEGMEDENYLYRGCYYTVEKRKKQESFFQNNVGLSENSLFDWESYYCKSPINLKDIVKGFVLLVPTFIFIFVKLVNGRKLYLFLCLNKLSKKKYLIHQVKCTKVDMAGRVVAIKKATDK